MDEEALLANIMRGDDASRAVYADWLEQRGHVEHAEYLRTQAILTGKLDRAVHDARMRRVRELARTLPLDWRKQVAHSRAGDPCPECGTLDPSEYDTCSHCSYARRPRPPADLGSIVMRNPPAPRPQLPTPPARVCAQCTEPNPAGMPYCGRCNAPM